MFALPPLLHYLLGFLPDGSTEKELETESTYIAVTVIAGSEETATVTMSPEAVRFRLSRTRVPTRLCYTIQDLLNHVDGVEWITLMIMYLRGRTLPTVTLETQGTAKKLRRLPSF